MDALPFPMRGLALILAHEIDEDVQIPIRAPVIVMRQPSLFKTIVVVTTSLPHRLLSRRSGAPPSRESAPACGPNDVAMGARHLGNAALQFELGVAQFNKQMAARTIAFIGGVGQGAVAESNEYGAGPVRRKIRRYTASLGWQ
jgi:hypothetical protein